MALFDRARRLAWGPNGDYLLVVALFLGGGAWLQGDGRVPLGDSWSFAWTAAQLVEHGRLAFTEAQAMTLVSQLLLVAPVAAVFSPAPSTLNRFTLVLSSITLALLLRLYRELGIERGLSLLAVATIATGALWLTQSMAFETEIYFLFFSILAALALVRWDRSPRSSPPWLAGLAFAAAAGVRQHALLLPIAGVPYLFATASLRLRNLLPFALPFLVVAAVYAWLHEVHGVPKAYGWQREMVRLRYSDPLNALASTCIGVVTVVHYLGWLLLPLSLATAERPAARWERVAIAAAGSLLVASTLVLAVGFGQTMPYIRQLLDPNVVLVALGLDTWSKTVDVLWTAVSTTGGVLLFAGLAGGVRHATATRVSPAAYLYLPGVALLFVGFNLVIGLGFDRYMLLPLPFLVPALLVGRKAGARRMAAAAALVTAGSLVSILMVDQRVRGAECEWDAAQALLRSGIPAPRINGGGHFNGYHAYDAIMNDPSRRKYGPPLPLVQPRAEYLVTPFVFDNSWMTELSSTSCPNLPGLRPIRMQTYRCPPSEAPGPPTICQPILP